MTNFAEQPKTVDVDAPEFSKKISVSWGLAAMFAVAVFVGTMSYYDLNTSKKEIETLDVTLSSDINTLEKRMDKRYKRQQKETEYLRGLIYQQRDQIIKLEKKTGI